MKVVGRHLKALVLILASVALFASCAHTATTEVVDSATVQSEADAEEIDANLMAIQTGKSLTNVKQELAFQNAFDAYASKVYEAYPEQINRLFIGLESGTKAIQFVNEVPATLAPAKSPLLTAETLSITGGGVLTLEDNIKRGEQAAQALNDLGYQNFVTFYSQPEQKIVAEVQVSDDGSIVTLSADDLARALTARLSKPSLQFQGLAKQVSADDIELVIIRADGPIVQEASSHGGQTVTDDDVDE